MPKKGFTSYVLKEKLYDFWKNEYDDNKDNLHKLGVTSFSGYITSIVNESIKKSLQNSNESFMSMIYLKDDLLGIRDNIQNCTVDLLIKNGKITCLVDDKDDCVHVGFAYSIPSVNILLNKKTNH